MNTGELIKYYRKLNNMTMEELGAKLKPPVGKSSISKWETGKVEHIRQSHIKQMSDIFEVSPLMFLDVNFPEITREENEKLLSIISADKDGMKMIRYYIALSLEGKEQVVDYAKYQYEKENKD